MNVLLSVPRSGNTLTRYYIEYITQRPTLGCNMATDGVDRPIYKRVFIPIKSETPLLVKCHSVKMAKKYLKNNDKLIVIIRNPSQSYGSSKKRSSKFKDDKWLKNYLNILKFYDEYKKDKLIIYYEDLINDPEIVISNIIEFFNEDKDRKKLLSNIKKHKEKAKKAYHTNIISGNKINMYTDISFKKLEKEIINSPYFKYLRRYYD